MVNMSRLLGFNFAKSSLYQSSKENRLFTVEVDRHCERASSHLYNFAKNPDEEFTVPSNCTDYGVNHQYQNGQKLRDDYFGDYISSTYDADQVYAQTSYKVRTIDSARA